MHEKALAWSYMLETLHKFPPQEYGLTPRPENDKHDRSSRSRSVQPRTSPFSPLPPSAVKTRDREHSAP